MTLIGRRHTLTMIPVLLGLFGQAVRQPAGGTLLLIALDDHEKSVRFKVGDTVWKCDLITYECSKGMYRQADELARLSR
jgi:hypothetical protein